MSFYERFVSLCDEKGIKPGRAAEDCGINRSNVTMWKNNGGTPRSNALQKLADYFGVTTDYLLGKETKKAPTNGERKDVLDEVDVAFYGEYKELDEDQKATIRDMVAVMRSRKGKRP